MPPNTVAHILLLYCLAGAAFARADVSLLRHNRPGHLGAVAAQQQHVTPYPSAGFRPDRQFNLPHADDTAPQFSREQPGGSPPPNALYGAPPQQQQRPTQSVPQRTYLAPTAERLRAAPRQPARLTSNREDQDDQDDVESFATSEIELNSKADAPQATATATVTAAASQPAAAFAYFPASFVAAPFAAYYQQPYQPTAYSAAYYTQLHGAAAAPLLATFPAAYFASVPAAVPPTPAAEPLARLQTASKAQQHSNQRNAQQPARLRAW